MISEKRLQEAIELYEELTEMDNSGLKRRVYRTVMRRRRRRIALAACAVVALPLIWVGVIWSLKNDAGPQPGVWSAGSVVLTLYDGSAIPLDGTVADTVAEVDVALFSANEGSLTVEKKTAPATVGRLQSCSVYVPRGKQYDIVLEDGTRVWLNSDSRLMFPSVFGDGERRVSVEGELFFQVRPDASRPFIVEAFGQRLEVLGTEFNVSAYPEDDHVVTTLLHGSVSVSNESGAAAVLSPDEQATFDRASRHIGVREVNAADVSAWKEGYFSFDENTLQQVMDKLSRWYDIEVSFDDRSLEDIIFKGTLPRYDDVSRVLAFIERSGTVKFSVRGNHVTVSK